MSYKYCIANPMIMTAIKCIHINTYCRYKWYGYVSFISLIAAYKSWAVHSILNEDTVGWQLFSSNVLIEHSHDIHPTLLPPFPRPHPALVSIPSYAVHPFTLRQPPKQHSTLTGIGGPKAHYGGRETQRQHNLYLSFKGMF